MCFIGFRTCADSFCKSCADSFFNSCVFYRFSDIYQKSFISISKSQPCSAPCRAGPCRIEIRAKISVPKKSVPKIVNSDEGSWILDPESRIQNPGFWILNPRSRIQGPGSQTLDPGSWIPDPEFRAAPCRGDFPCRVLQSVPKMSCRAEAGTSL